ncbi:Crp/Fnr family transcriptional regulator [Cohnella candidum]|uniref:Crp/Fnr family transcriptional regulator n=1 Tax=Cohnella candidum TaxID=2674991 RepID=A0A3G3K390_9BACL|nr:Crp/Fnr family transcriptional regulator [Cohnella candidum]AYQ74840.1 Crp/Fnr family transcriptional regulator [Cohnella candidum]
MHPTALDTPFFQGIIRDEDREAVLSLFAERHYPKGSVVFFHGDECREMYIIKTGALKIYRQDADREIVLGHQFAGESIGELEVFHYDKYRMASVAAIEKSVLWMIKKSDLEALTKKYPEILRKAFYVVSERLNQADRKLQYLAFLDTRVRVANLLLDLGSNFGKETDQGLEIQWKVTQQHFANMIGVGRETAARALQELQQEGVIRIRNKQFSILDLETLKAIAGPDQVVSDSRKWHSTHKYMI